MQRKFLFDWYLSPKGQLLQQQEIDFLRRGITVSCKQAILQVGALGWEDQFIDCSLYKKFVIADAHGRGCSESLKIRSIANLMPIKTESIDMIILPHLLEFEHNQHHVLREIERILKPEGKLLILSFNPWRLHTHWQYFKSREKHDPWRGLFISRVKIIDWLNLLNFEIETIAGFNFDISKSQSQHFDASGKISSFFAAAYAVKAVKRRYHMIPLTPARNRRFRLAVVGAMESPNRTKHYE
jgi:SAM-dependent methyltransferase